MNHSHFDNILGYHIVRASRIDVFQFEASKSIMTLLLEHKSDLLNEKDPTHKDITPLGVACKKGVSHLIPLLLENGADKTQVTSEEMTMVDLYEESEKADEDVNALLTE